MTNENRAGSDKSFKSISFKSISENIFALFIIFMGGIFANFPTILSKAGMQLEWPNYATTLIAILGFGASFTILIGWLLGDKLLFWRWLIAPDSVE